MSFPVRIRTRLQTRARRDHGLDFFDFTAEVVGHEDGTWARWSDETARTYDRSFEGWTVERRISKRTSDAWEGFPARLVRGDVEVTFHEDGSLQLRPAGAILDADVVSTLQGAMRGTAVRGRRSALADHRAEIIESIRVRHAQSGSRPTMDGVAQLMGCWSDTEDRASSTFRHWVSEAGGWDHLVREALG